MPGRERSPGPSSTRTSTPTRRPEGTPRKTPSKRLPKDDESLSPLVSPSKRTRTPRTSGARRLARELAHDVEEKENATTSSQPQPEEDEGPVKELGRRAVKLFQHDEATTTTTAATSTRDEKTNDADKAPKTPQKEKSSRWVNGVEVMSATPSSAVKSSSVKKAYSIVQKCTGSLGGNGSGGAIYGELTVGSMQKVVHMMMMHCKLDKDSLFIDIGSGLGKPNIHVAQYPGVAASYGIEHEHVRHQLSLHNLRHLVKMARQQQESSSNEEEEDQAAEGDKISHKIYFQHGDVYDARTLDPFTHIYMFDIGFPPKLFYHLASIYNDSQAPWLTCYHGPKLMVDRYGFNLVLLDQISTSMHGSSEGHTAYFYARAGSPPRPLVTCDPLFADGIKIIREKSLEEMHEWLEEQLSTQFNSPRPSRRRSNVNRLLAAEI